MYRPHGRYRYVGGVNWRAALALLIAVPPLLPGLINSINPKIEVGGGVFLFDIAYLFGLFVASAVYYTSSKLFPAEYTMLDSPIYDDHDSVTKADESSIVKEIESEKDVDVMASVAN